MSTCRRLRRQTAAAPQGNNNGRRSLGCQGQQCVSSRGPDSQRWPCRLLWSCCRPQVSITRRSRSRSRCHHDHHYHYHLQPNPRYTHLHPTRLRDRRTYGKPSRQFAARLACRSSCGNCGREADSYKEGSDGAKSRRGRSSGVRGSRAARRGGGGGRGGGGDGGLG